MGKIRRSSPYGALGGNAAMYVTTTPARLVCLIETSASLHDEPPQQAVACAPLTGAIVSGSHGGKLMQECRKRAERLQPGAKAGAGRGEK